MMQAWDAVQAQTWERAPSTCVSADQQCASVEGSELDENLLMQLPRTKHHEEVRVDPIWAGLAPSDQEAILGLMRSVPGMKVNDISLSSMPGYCCEAVSQGLLAYTQQILNSCKTSLPLPSKQLCNMNLTALQVKLDAFCETQDPSVAISEFSSMPETISKGIDDFINGSVGGGVLGTDVPSECSTPTLPSESILPLCSATPLPDFLGIAVFNWSTSFTNETRMKQATLATTIFAMVTHALEGYGLLDHLSAIYHVYFALSGDGAGVYYPDSEYGPIVFLPRHQSDIKVRCALSEDCAYSRGRHDEYKRHAFRMLNALETAIFSAIMSTQGSEPQDALKGMWGYHYRASAQEMGESIWQISPSIAEGIKGKWVKTSY